MANQHDKVSSAINCEYVLKLFLYGFKSMMRISLTSSSFSCKCLTMCWPRKPLPPDMTAQKRTGEDGDETRKKKYIIQRIQNFY